MHKRLERERFAWPVHRPGEAAITLTVDEFHFIDFETATPALPFHVGQQPHQGLLFQFSLHVLEEDARLRQGASVLR